MTGKPLRSVYCAAGNILTPVALLRVISCSLALSGTGIETIAALLDAK